MAVAAILLVAVAVFGILQAAKAALLGRDGKAALIRSESHLSARDLDGARRDLDVAHASFREMGDRLDRMGPLLTIARFVPVVRSQVIAVETMQGAGASVSLAGQRLADAAQKARDSSKEGIPLSGALDRLRTIQSSLGSGATTLREAQSDVAELDGRWLIGPIGSAQHELSGRLGKAVRQASSAESGMAALIDFAGGNGPRRYLFLSQNPDEIRPTGGFLGMLGLFTADAGNLDLHEFESSIVFSKRHPQAVIPGSEAGSPFRFAQPPIPQRIGNVNHTPDWPRSAQLAVELWERGGEEPVDGVVTFTPAFLARILGVLGPVTVPEYGETVTSDNLIERFDYYTELEESEQGDNDEKKQFVAQLADKVLGRLLEAPSSSWEKLGGAMGDGFAAREGMVWSRHPEIDAALQERKWDGAFPAADGDFFYNGEFSYAAKNGRGLKRTFDHEVALRKDGSARVTTTMRVANTEEFGRYNRNVVNYVTIYGPAGASLDPASDPPASMETPLSGHPAVGYFVTAPPGGFRTLKVVWDAPDVARRGTDGAWQYSLTWLRIPDHSGDVLNVHVSLPNGWRWKKDGPPSTVELTSDVRGSWPIAR